MDANVLSDAVGADDCDVVDLTMSEVPIDSPEVAASLPPPDQYDRSPSGRNLFDPPKKSRKCLWLGFTGVVLLALILGLSLGLTGSNNSSKATTAPEARKASFDAAVSYFESNNVSSVADMRNNASPQSKALAWLTGLDDRNLPVPTGHSISTPVGYHYLTRYVLAVLYFAMNGANWYIKSSWLSGDDFCSWNSVVRGSNTDLYIGTTCDNVSRKLVSLRLDANNLRGTIPKELRMLTTLRMLTMFGNSLQGGFPQEVCDLPELGALLLSHNELIGELPRCLSNLTQMQLLVLSDNEFSGSLPDLSGMRDMLWLGLDNNTRLTGTVTSAFNSMTKLRLLYLDDTSMSGHIDHNFLKGCANLTEVDISGCDFRGGFPSHLIEFPLLEVLDLHGNALYGSLPENIKPNSALKLLALHENQFNGTIPNSISNLHSLFHLDLSENLFSGTIPTTISNMTSLQRLFLSENRFAAGPVPVEFQNLTGLRELSLKGTRRSGPIPAFFGDMENLTLLDLAGNSFNGSIPSEIGDLSNLQFLLLNRNENLKGTVPDTFGKLSGLRVILLDRTDLNGSLEVLCNLSTFKETPGDADGTEVISADCPSEVECDCCTTCCRDDDPDSCHDHGAVPNLDPEWQYRYDRVSFQFGDSAYFVDRSYINAPP